MFEFEVENESHTTSTCGFFEDEFEGVYFLFFSVDSLMWAVIETNTDGFQTLRMVGSIFDDLYFRNTPVLATPEFSKTKIALYPKSSLGSIAYL